MGDTQQVIWKECICIGLACMHSPIVQDACSHAMLASAMSKGPSRMLMQLCRGRAGALARCGGQEDCHAHEDR